MVATTVILTTVTIARRTVTVVATTTETQSTSKAAITVSSIMILTALRAQTYITYILFRKMRILTLSSLRTTHRRQRALKHPFTPL